jgi:hypothetical protein
MSNIKEFCMLENDGLFLASRFHAKLHKPTTACVLRLMEPLAGMGVILHGDSWFASLNTLQKLKPMSIYFVGLIKKIGNRTYMENEELGAEIIADGDGYDACEWVSGLQVHHRGGADPPGVYQQRCTGHECRGGGVGGGAVAAATRGARQAHTDALMARADSGDLPHALFNGRALGLGGTGGEGQ